MKALVLNCTLKRSPATSNTEALARVVMDALSEVDEETEIVRVVDHDVRPGVSSDEGEGDDWPAIHEKLLADIGYTTGLPRPAAPRRAISWQWREPSRRIRWGRRRSSRPRLP